MLKQRFSRLQQDYRELQEICRALRRHEDAIQGSMRSIQLNKTKNQDHDHILPLSLLQLWVPLIEMKRKIIVLEVESSMSLQHGHYFD